MKTLWGTVLLIMLFVYGAFLIIQSQVELWPSKQFHSVVQLGGGISMLLWGARYFIHKPKILVYVINAVVIATLAGLCILVPLLLLRVF